MSTGSVPRFAEEYLVAPGTTVRSRSEPSSVLLLGAGALGVGKAVLILSQLRHGCLETKTRQQPERGRGRGCPILERF